MALEPVNRYATAMDLAEDLERFLADESVSVCRDSAAVKIVRTIRRNRTASIAILGALAVGSVALLFAAASQGVMATKAQRSAQDRLKMAATMVATMGGMEIDRRPLGQLGISIFINDLKVFEQLSQLSIDAAVSRRC